MATAHNDAASTKVVTTHDRDRLDPAVLAEDAASLVARTANGTEVVELVARLLRQIRENDDQQRAIREGYEFSNRMERWLHECALADQIQNVANAIRREVGRRPAGNAEMSYDGGLRRAYRIANGVAAAFRMEIVPREPSQGGGS